MRRKDREKDRDFALDVIKRSEYSVLSMITPENTPYGIPISHVLSDEVIYFHSAKEGKKSEILETNSRVSLTCVCDTELVPEKFTTKYKSAVVVGNCSLVTEDSEKKAALMLICEKYAGSNIESAGNSIERNLNITSVYKITPIEITGKGNI